MNLKWISNGLLAMVTAVVVSGCLMRQTVTSGGEVVEETYVIKRPLRDAVERSE